MIAWPCALEQYIMEAGMCAKKLLHPTAERKQRRRKGLEARCNPQSHTCCDPLPSARSRLPEQHHQLKFTTSCGGCFKFKPYVRTDRWATKWEKRKNSIPNPEMMH